MIEAAAELGPMAEHHELSVSTEPAMVDGVRDELHRLVLNLMENALRHTPPGTSVHAGVRRDGDQVVIEVADTGPGIPAELAPRVFERFVRNGRDGGKGSGLGLAIVRSVAQSHGGRSSSSRRPKGSAPLRDQAARARQRIDRGHLVVPTSMSTCSTPVSSGRRGAADGRRGRAAQTSTTTGRTIGRRRNRS